MAKAAPKAAPKSQGQGRAKAPQQLVRPAAGRLQPPLPPSPLQVGQEVPADELAASMIDDLRACTHKQLPELFPLMASLHPELQLRTLTDSPPLKQRRTHCDLEQAWDCILRKLPMLFEHFCGAEAWEVPAVWEQHCYDSALAGKAVSAEDHRLAVNTAYVMGFDGELPGLLPGAGRHAAALGPQDSHSPHHPQAGLQGRAGLRHG